METTQKPRGDAPARRPGRTEAGKQPQNHKPVRKPPAGEQAAPPSAQQSNGALRTEQAQRQGVERHAQEARQRPSRPAGEKPRKPVKKAPEKKAPARKPLRRPREDDDTLSSKRRAYGNSKPKKKSAVSAVGEVFKRSAEKKKEKREAPVKSRRQHPQQPTPAVIYTEPKTFNRSRFLMQLITVAAIVAALTLGLSVFFKVENITVSGAEVYSAWAVREASGIEEGDNLLSFGNIRAAAKIKANLPYLDEVRIGIKLPNTVNIMVKEEDVVYAIKSSDGIWWLMTSDGRVVEQASGGKASSYTQILGVNLDNPVPDGKAVAAESVPTETGEDGAVIPVAVTGAQRLNAALEILEALEANGIVGGAASVDVTRIEDIILWYGTRYQVNLGDANSLDYKITCMNDAILQLSDYQSGILDISFTIWPDQIGYTPFA